MIDIDKVQTVLKDNNKSLTRARKIILQKLSQNTPLEMKDLIKITASDLDRASVYRNISLFENLGIVLKLQIGWKYKLELSESFAPHHHHLICEDCGKIIDIKDLTIIENEINKLAFKKEFLAKSHQLDIVGICKECQNKMIRE